MTRRRRDNDRGREGYMRQIDWPNGVDDDYEPAPLEHNLAQARGMLARLYGRNLQLIASAPVGICDDCRQSVAADEQNGHLRPIERIRYGRFELCRRCALCRRNAREAA